MKKLQNLLLSMMAMVSIGLADENNYISDTTKTTENQTQTSQNQDSQSNQSQSSQSDSGVKHRFGIGLGYGIPWMTVYGGYPRKTYSSSFDNVYLVGSYQILYPIIIKNSHITNGIELMAGLGYVNYGCDGDVLTCIGVDSVSGFSLSLGAFDVIYRPMSDSLRLGVKAGIEYNMMYFPNNGYSFRIILMVL